MSSITNALFRGLFVIKVSVVGDVTVVAGNPPRDRDTSCVVNATAFDAPPQILQEKLGLDPSCATYSAGFSNGYVLSVVNAICSLWSDLPLTFSNWSQGISR